MNANWEEIEFEDKRLRGVIAELRAEVTKLTAERDALDKSEGVVIMQRDEADEAFDALVGLFGVEAEYSNIRGRDEIHEDCADALAARDARMKAEGLREAAKYLRESAYGLSISSETYERADLQANRCRVEADELDRMAEKSPA